MTDLDLGYNDIEEGLRASVRDLLADRAPVKAVLTRAETDEPYDPAVWRALSELGVAALPIPEKHGGAGASWREAAVVAEELGSSLAGTPLLGSTVIATAVLLELGADDLLKQLSTGERTAALVVPFAITPAQQAFTVSLDTATVRTVVDADADVLLVPAADGALYAVESAGVRRRRVVSLDLTRPLYDLEFAGGSAQSLARGAAAQQAVRAGLITGAALLASEQLGIAERCLAMTVDYLKARHQFGRPIGSFQALKHRVADLWAATTQARAVARYAVASLDTRDAEIAASLAQAYCGPVALRAAEECVQLHGGIGFTWEHPAHLYLKRAKADSIALGTAAAHRAQLGTLVDL